MSGQVTEGFLCPICMKDLGNISQLQNHFDETHQYEDKDILQSVKGIIGKAKKALKFDSTSYDSDKDKNYNKGSNINERLPFEYYVQPLGIFVTHSIEYKQMRSERYDTYIKETNKLILRLHSLINMENVDDINKRKEFERTVVNWIPDHLVHNCPYCAKVFNMTHRRRHHCRLCGSVLCHKCSQFISFNAARTLIEPKHADLDSKLPSPSNTSIPLPNEESLSFNMATNLTKLRRSDSVSSLVSYVSPTTGQGHVRICQDCAKALSWRSALLLHNNASPDPTIRTFTALYNEMSLNVGEIRKLIPAYCAKVESLNSYGKSFYQLDQATALRKRILRCGEKVENLSRAISVEPPNTTTEASHVNPSLRKAVRSYACRLLKDNFLSLPRLPDRETLKQWILESPQLEPLPKDTKAIEPVRNTKFVNVSENQQTPDPSSSPSNPPQTYTIDTVNIVEPERHQAQSYTSLNPFDETDDSILDKETPHLPNGVAVGDINKMAATITTPKTQLRDEDLIPAQALAEQIENVRAYLARAQLGTDNLDETYTLETNLRQLQQQLIAQKKTIAAKLSIPLDDVIL